MNTQVKTEVKRKVDEKAYTEMDKLGVLTVSLFSFGVGLWSLVCLSSLIATEGLLGTFSSFFKALG